MLQDQLPGEISFPANVVHAKSGFELTPEKQPPYVLKLRYNSGGERSCVLDNIKYSRSNGLGYVYAFTTDSLDKLSKFESFLHKKNDIGINITDFSEGRCALILHCADLTVASSGGNQTIAEWAIRHGGVPNYEAMR